MQICDLNKANAPHYRMIDDFLLNCGFQLQIKKKLNGILVALKISFDASELSRFV